MSSIPNCRRLVGTLIAATVTVGVIVASSQGGQSAAYLDGDAPIRSTQVIEEDSPLWDCHTMGNLICGPGHGGDN